MQPTRFQIAALAGTVLGFALPADEEEVKFADCPAAVRKTFLAEAKGVKIETAMKERNEENEIVYWAKVEIGARTYEVGALEDGTLTEMSLAVADEDLPLERCPAPVQTTFRSEAFGEKIDVVGKDVKYGQTVYQTAITHKGKTYEIVVAEDGTMVEKALVIDDEDVKLSDCPATVRSALHEHARGGEIGDITRSSGISQQIFEAEVKIKDRVYLIEVAEGGNLISKSLEAVRN